MTLPSSLQRVAHSATDLLHTRLSLFSVEAQALGWVALQTLVRGALAGMLLLVALVCAVVALVLVVPPPYRAAVLGGLALLLSLGAAALWHTARQQWHRLGSPFAASLAELAGDRAALQPQDPPA